MVRSRRANQSDETSSEKVLWKKASLKCSAPVSPAATASPADPSRHPAVEPPALDGVGGRAATNASASATRQNGGACLKGATHPIQSPGHGRFHNCWRSPDRES